MNNQFVMQAGDNSFTFNQVQLHAGDEITKPFYRYKKWTLREISEKGKFKNAIAQSQQLAFYDQYLDKPFGEFLKYLDCNGFQRELSLFLNKYGNKKFREFYIKDHLSSKGLYAYKHNEEIVYFGRCCDNFNKRINANGYGNISPRNCLDDGQPTNTKLNSYVFEHWDDITFWICPMNDCGTNTIKNYEYQFFATNAKPKLNGNVPRKPKNFIEESGQNHNATLMKFVAKNGEFYLQLLEGAHFKFVTQEGKHYIQRKAANEENGAMFHRLKQALRALNLSENDEKPFPLFSGEKMKTFNLPDFEFQFNPLPKMSDRIKKLSFKADDQLFYLQKNPDAKPKFQFLDENSSPITEGAKNRKKLTRLAIHLFGKSEVENLPEDKKTNNALGFSIFKHFRGVNGEVIPLPGFQFNLDRTNTTTANIKSKNSTMKTSLSYYEFEADDIKFCIQKNLKKGATKYELLNAEKQTILEDKESALKKLKRIVTYLIGQYELNKIPKPNQTNNTFGDLITKKHKIYKAEILRLTGFKFFE